ncbi:MAG: hypothetical protein CL706_04445 [Chloroflexi bacterium]|nr:hypothetical protein [Chloroflexota bacterium]
MDLVVIAQIVTSTATLIVALVLVYQLRQQRRDAERDVILSINSQRLALSTSLNSDKTLSELQYRGNHNFEDLKDQDERTRYYRQFAAEMNLHNISILYSDLIQLDAKNYLKNQLGLFPGIRKMYRESMIRHQLPTNFVKICDEIVKEIELEVGEDGQITDLTRSDIKK